MTITAEELAARARTVAEKAIAALQEAAGDVDDGTLHLAAQHLVEDDDVDESVALAAANVLLALHVDHHHDEHAPPADGDPPTVHEIQLLLQTADEDEVVRIADEIARLVCGDDPTVEHTCPIPWFISIGEIEDSDDVRDLLNR